VGALWAAIGAVLVLFGVVGLMVGVSPWAVWAHLLVGLGLLVAAAVQSSAKLGEFLASDAGRRGGSTILQTAVVLGITGMVAWLSVRHPVHWDWTEAKVHSLARGSRDVLAQIPSDGQIEILAFYTSGNELEARSRLEPYTYESPRVRVRYVDPNRRPDLAAKHEVRSEGVVIVCGGPCDTAKGTVRLAQVTEEEVTRAIRSVLSSRRKVYFTTGHGEASPKDEQASGMTAAATALGDENIEVEELLLANADGVPEDADAVVIAGPSHSVFEREIRMLDAFLRRGGSVLVLIDPLVVTKLEEPLRAWGVEVGDDVVVEEQIQLFSGPQLGVQPVVTSYGAHPITEKLASQPTMFTIARSVRPASGVEPAPIELLRTAEKSWAETDLSAFTERREVQLDPAADRVGPVSLAVARTFPRDGVAKDDGAQDVGNAGGEREGRLVVIGDSDFARNRYVTELYNADFLLNTVSWMVGEEAFVTVERKTPRASMVRLSEQQFANFRFAALFVLPEAIVLLGILTWWRRRVAV
jgi:ABC-type uncharacterized transport system involved in gliding motility auxiliary subunit